MIGIDKIIDNCKTAFEDDLWTTVAGYTAYGRAFVNERDGLKVPEVLDSGNEYGEVKLNTGLDATSFFIVEDDYTVSNDVCDGKVTVYFAVNLSCCYQNVSERAVEYVHRDVAAILKHTDFELTQILNGWGDFEGKYHNMQPYYLVRFITTVKWLLDQC